MELCWKLSINSVLYHACHFGVNWLHFHIDFYEFITDTAPGSSVHTNVILLINSEADLSD